MDVGIQLTVKPRISEEGYITLDIEPEVSTARRVPDVSNALAVDTSRAKTVMTVKDGRTVVLGGLIKDEKIDTVKKVPLLGDIPVLGFFFKNKDKSDVKTELIIFITPHIIKDDLNAE
jgi:general secretion pathway protein D